MGVNIGSGLPGFDSGDIPIFFIETRQDRVDVAADHSGTVDFVILRRGSSEYNRVYVVETLQEYLNTTSPYTNVLYRVNRVFSGLAGLFNRNAQVVRNVPAEGWRDHIATYLEGEMQSNRPFFEGRNVVAGFRNTSDAQLSGIESILRPITRIRSPIIVIDLPIEEPKKKPDAVMDKLTEKFEEKPKAENLFIEYTDQKGVDAGGLRRQFVSDLFEGVVTNSDRLQFKKNAEGEFHPVAKNNESGMLEKEEEEGYKQLGQVLVFCHRAGDPIGQVFSDETMRGLFAFTEEELNKDFGGISDERMLEIYREIKGDPEKKFLTVEDPMNLTDEELKQALSIAVDYDPKGLIFEDNWYEMTSNDIKEKFALIKKVIKEGREKSPPSMTERQTRLHPLHVIAQAMANPDFDSKQEDTLPGIKQKYGNDPIAFSKAIQGEMNNTLILDRVELGVEVPAKVKEWFQSWLESADDAKKKAFLKAITGSPTITAGSDKKIVFIKYWGDALNIHTCGWQMDIPEAAVVNEELFHAALDGSLGGDEFSTL